jgi:hypothetical protein
MKSTKQYSTSRIMQLLLILVLYAGAVTSSSAIDIQITQATKQAWAGGSSYSNGVSYNIGLLIFPSKYPVILDSLWLEGNCRSLASYNYKGRSKSDTLSVYIMDGLNYDGKIQVDANWCKDPTKKGVIIGYHQHNQRFLLDITPYLKELDFIGYP